MLHFPDLLEAVKAGLRNARAKGKRLGRPKKILDTNRITALRAKGVGWKRIAAEIGVGVGTLYRLALDGSKIRQKVLRGSYR
jgi:DNA invertase Pin-like site-specific DNA recombinase